MDRKIRVAVIFGGRSAEHEVSLQSAKSVLAAIDRDLYEPVLIGIDKDGRWYLNEESTFLLDSDDPKMIRLNRSEELVAIVQDGSASRLINAHTRQHLGTIDVAFPILHGPYGEDGTIQGLLKLAGIPWVGADVLGSAIGMDKDVMKRLLRDAGLPTNRFHVLTRSNAGAVNFDALKAELGCPIFVKPANLGSSVGISKVADAAAFDQAVATAFRYDRKVLIEEYVKGREIECSVLGNEDPIASLPGEVVLRSEFYSYEAKYIDESGAALEIPAKIPAPLIDRVRSLAVAAFKTLCCEGMARVDFFLRNQAEILINELNTIPGFTRISMYPKLWEASGISYRELVRRLIELALDRHDQQQRLSFNVRS